MHRLLGCDVVHATCICKVCAQMSKRNMQGRVACEIASGDELITTEMIFGGVLTPLSAAEAAALLSALVFQASSTCC